MVNDASRSVRGTLGTGGLVSDGVPPPAEALDGESADAALEPAVGPVEAVPDGLVVGPTAAPTEGPAGESAEALAGESGGKDPVGGAAGDRVG